MKCKYRNCGKELPKGHNRIYCDNKCMGLEGKAKQTARLKQDAFYGRCIECGDVVRKTGRHMTKYCDKPECQKIRNELIAKKQVDRSKNDRMQERKKLNNNEGCVLLEDGSIPEYYLTRGDPFTHGICSR